MDLHQHFQNIRQLIRQAKSDAWIAINASIVTLHWQVGGYLSVQLSESTYGDKVVETFAAWLLEQEPQLPGFDRRSLYRMRQFFETWVNVEWESYLGEPGDKAFHSSATAPVSPIVATLSPQLAVIPAPLLRVSWSQHIDLLTSTTTEEERLFCLFLSFKERYTVRDLRRQIKSSLFERQMLSKGNLLLPEHPQKDLLANIFRDRYAFEFLDLPEPQP